MNYFFIGASFFSFHLLLAYLVDHISVHASFIIASVVSVALVISYMRLVVGPRFAFLRGRNLTIRVSGALFVQLFLQGLYRSGNNGSLHFHALHNNANHGSS